MLGGMFALAYLFCAAWALDLLRSAATRAAVRLSSCSRADAAISAEDGEEVPAFTDETAFLTRAPTDTPCFKPLLPVASNVCPFDALVGGSLREGEEALVADDSAFAERFRRTRLRVSASLPAFVARTAPD